jgi:peptidoglycan/LPS O-acetylase OafA/YrhL
LFTGGFLDVDVFFVISGFLITSLLVQEQESTGTISFLGFYERRARRLLPVLVLVMLVSVLPAWLLLYPQQLLDFAKSLLASLFLVSNFYWYSSLQVYGPESALLKPLLHTWSKSPSADAKADPPLPSYRRPGSPPQRWSVFALW